MKCKAALLSILMVFIFLSPCVAAPMDLKSEEYDTSKYEISHSTERAQLWVEKNYMSEKEIAQLGELVDEGIKKVEDYLGTSFEKEYGHKSKITYYIKSGNFVSHVYGGYDQNQYLKPIVFLSYSKEKKTPYLHETVHILSPEFSSLWVREGLAVYLNDKLGGYPCFPNLGKDIDLSAMECLAIPKNPLPYVGENGIPKIFQNNEERNKFYTLSGSFVKYIENKIGIQKFMVIYKAPDTQKAFQEITQKSIEDWKKEWIGYLKTPKNKKELSSALKVTLDGRELNFDVLPFIENGRTLVPLRTIFEALGAEIVWNGETQTVMAKKEGTEIQLVIGGEAYKNGQLIPLDVPAKSLNGRTMVPLRFVSEALGCRIGWNDETQTITIISQ